MFFLTTHLTCITPYTFIKINYHSVFNSNVFHTRTNALNSIQSSYYINLRIDTISKISLQKFYLCTSVFAYQEINSSSRYLYLNPAKHKAGFQSNAECFLALKQGKEDAFTQDSVIIAGVAGKEGVEYEAISGIYSPGLYSIGVPLNDSKWRDKVSFVLQDLMRDGTYDKIYEKWFGKDGMYH